MDEIKRRLANLKMELDTLTAEVETKADSDISHEEFNKFNNLVVYLQETRRSLRQVMNVVKGISNDA